MAQKNYFNLVCDFHTKYKLGSRPSCKKLQAAKIRHLKEELKEYIKAVRNSDREQQLDALIDLVYVALGAAYFEQFNFDKAFKTEHAANMKKVAMPTKRSAWDVVKPKGWKAPNIKRYT